jgi:hypothetical protein
MHRSPVKLILLSLSLVMVSFSLQAQQAVLPYSLVSKYMDLFQSLEHLDRIVPEMMIVSTNAAVKPQDIEFKIRVSESWETFSPNESGIIQFPNQPEWASLSFISNQPKGTLQMGVSYSAVPLTSTQISYQELMGLVPQFREALEALASLQGLPAPEVTGLTIQLPEGTDASVRIDSQKGKRTLNSYSTGSVVLKYDDGLWAENPPVEFDQLPIGIVPLR